MVWRGYNGFWGIGWWGCWNRQMLFSNGKMGAARNRGFESEIGDLWGYYLASCRTLVSLESVVGLNLVGGPDSNREYPFHHTTQRMGSWKGVLPVKLHAHYNSSPIKKLFTTCRSIFKARFRRKLLAPIAFESDNDAEDARPCAILLRMLRYP